MTTGRAAMAASEPCPAVAGAVGHAQPGGFHGEARHLMTACHGGRMAPGAAVMASGVMASNGWSVTRLYCTGGGEAIATRAVRSPRDPPVVGGDAPRQPSRARPRRIAHSTGEWFPSARSNSYGTAGYSGGWAMKRGRVPWWGWAAWTRKGWQR